MKIKIIDLLNEIANGEEVPKKIKHEGLIYNWDITGYLHYEDEHTRERAFLEGYRTDMCLNDEVEIIEEDKPIEELKIARNEKDNKMFLRVENHHATMRKIDVVFATKINELVKEINKMKGELNGTNN